MGEKTTPFDDAVAYYSINQSAPSSASNAPPQTCLHRLHPATAAAAITAAVCLSIDCLSLSYQLSLQLSHSVFSRRMLNANTQCGLIVNRAIKDEVRIFLFHPFLSSRRITLLLLLLLSIVIGSVGKTVGKSLVDSTKRTRQLAGRE